MKSEFKQKKSRKLSKNQILIKKFVNVEFYQNKYFWPKEMKFMSKLIKAYGIEFLEWLTPPSNYKLTSLIYFFTPQGENYLSDQLFEYKKVKIDLTFKKQEVELEGNKIGEDITIEKKPKSLKDFLNLYKNK